MVRVLSGFWAADSNPYGLLVLLLTTIFVVAPLVSMGIAPTFILRTAFGLILAAGAFKVTSRLTVRVLALGLAALTVVFGSVDPAYSRVFIAADITLSIVMLSVFAAFMTQQFLPRGREPIQRIAGAVSIYLLLGLIWARLYELVELVAPGAFRLPEGETLGTGSLVYFSFVTLATLGYGDISPMNLVARNLAILEALVGQLYLVILISRLVTEGVEPSDKGCDR